MSHQHGVKYTDTQGFQQCVNPSNCTPSAHGGIMEIRTCACGATRLANLNHQTSEITTWEA